MTTLIQVLADLALTNLANHSVETLTAYGRPGFLTVFSHLVCFSSHNFLQYFLSFAMLNV